MNINSNNKEIDSQEDISRSNVTNNTHNDKKENKLRFLFDNKQNEVETDISKNLARVSKISFNVNDFPDLDEVSNVENESNLEKEFENLEDDSNFAVVTKKYLENNKGNKKKKKFVSLNVNILSAPTEKMMDVQGSSSHKKSNTNTKTKQQLKKK
jgi:hypothetical protein